MPTLAPSTPQPSTLNPQPCFYPARPVNGGPLPQAQPKHGAWAWEPKYNGWRALVHAPTGRMFNRHLEPLSISAEFTDALALLKKLNLEWCDTEALDRRHALGRGTLLLLDYLPPDRGPSRAAPTYADRRALLSLAAAFADIATHQQLHQPPPPRTVLLVPSYVDRTGTGVAPALQAQIATLPPPLDVGCSMLDVGCSVGCSLESGLWPILQACNRTLRCDFYEGLVAKRLDSPYPLQRTEKDFPFWTKHRWAF